MESAGPPDTMIHGTHAGGSTGTRREGALRRLLDEEPNNERAFTELVSELAGSSRTLPARALTWSLAEEMAQHPRAWFPLLELARLSLPDLTAASHWIQIAVRRDPGGTALARAVPMLAAAGYPADAFQLAIAHWRPASHGVATGRHLVHAALATGRTQELRRYLGALSPAHRRVVWVLRAELESRFAVQQVGPRRPTTP